VAVFRCHDTEKGSKKEEKGRKKEKGKEKEKRREKEGKKSGEKRGKRGELLVTTGLRGGMALINWNPEPGFAATGEAARSAPQFQFWIQ
jgi:hypothetical protein